MTIPSGKALRSALLRGCMLFGVWLALTDAARDSLAFGLLLVLVATALSFRVLGPPQALVDPRRLPAFVGRFVRDSLVGGVDVARRALSPHPRLAPGLIVCRLSLPTDVDRVLLADIVTLLPGTLSADLDGAELTVHALDRHHDILAQVRALETAIRGLRGEA